MKDAVRQDKEGVVLELEVSPGAKETSVHGYNPWRRRIEIRVSQKAEKGKANSELISFFSDLFKINSGNIHIVKGSTSSKKSVKITGVNVPLVLKVLLRNEHKNS
jgi:uncharacterized protein (TIGR00251 family)